MACLGCSREFLLIEEEETVGNNGVVEGAVEEEMEESEDEEEEEDGRKLCLNCKQLNPECLFTEVGMLYPFCLQEAGLYEYVIAWQRDQRPPCPSKLKTMPESIKNNPAVTSLSRVLYSKFAVPFSLCSPTSLTNPTWLRLPIP